MEGVGKRGRCLFHPTLEEGNPVMDVAVTIALIIGAVIIIGLAIWAVVAVFAG